jgi:hypothetical protein
MEPSRRRGNPMTWPERWRVAVIVAIVVIVIVVVVIQAVL